MKQDIDHVYELQKLVGKNIEKIESETSDKLILNEFKKYNDIVNKSIKEIIDRR